MATTTITRCDNCNTRIKKSETRCQNCTWKVAAAEEAQAKILGASSDATAEISGATTKSETTKSIVYNDAYIGRLVIQTMMYSSNETSTHLYAWDPGGNTPCLADGSPGEYSFENEEDAIEALRVSALYRAAKAARAGKTVVYR